MLKGIKRLITIIITLGIFIAANTSIVFAQSIPAATDPLVVQETPSVNPFILIAFFGIPLILGGLLGWAIRGKIEKKKSARFEDSEDLEEEYTRDEYASAERFEANARTQSPVQAPREPLPGAQYRAKNEVAFNEVNQQPVRPIREIPSIQTPTPTPAGKIKQQKAVPAPEPVYFVTEVKAKRVAKASVPVLEPEGIDDWGRPYYYTADGEPYYHDPHTGKMTFYTEA